MTTADHRAALTVGAVFRFATYFAPYRNVKGEWVENRERGSRHSVWEVLRLEDRGLVIGHPLNGTFGTAGGHEHLLEWNETLAFFELGPGIRA